jgi:lipopolysaccharide/colanic/teichoic acid biosynthesis glycosyltransferase
MRIGAPALFIQERPGKGKRIFHLYKFRTMREAFGPDGRPLSDADRMTPTGALLRRLSLDELPQLLNVLVGDMSLVGPRPLLVRYLERYTAEQARRHLVKPGITGWAQINGRNAISWEQKFDLDIWYVDHQSLWLDLKILYLTVKKVVCKDGITADGEATISEFMGPKPATGASKAMEK